MSQILVTGEAKIRDIQGPVVANSGVITALDGAANQYVRGDGTLAIFPTSSGGGSSVSYYLNGSVNQGTFGGSTYYQMSRNAIVGTGTNFSTSSDGLIAQFITDANDPDVVSIPSGNWNVEFFMNVSASSGALASFYVEIYKYNGSTFTLLATNVATPEQLTNTTTVDAYFTSVAMPLSAMAVTDRLAVRIFANVASKTVTLYTEDNRLCQIVTTFSNGLTSLNNLTDQSQYLTTGTSGTNFNIVSSGDTHTFNLPVASATNTGKLSSTDWSTFNAKQPAGNYVTLDTTQTITAEKTFTQNLSLDGNGSNAGTLLLKNNTISPVAIGYASINSNGNNINLTAFVSATKTASFDLSGISDNIPRTFTFPNASGTLALTSNLSSYVPYTGATGSVNLGLNNLTANNVFGETSLNVKILPSGSVFSTGYSVLSSLAGKFTMAQEATAGNLKAFTFDFSAWATNTSRTYSLPDITGTLALLEGTQTFTGDKLFNGSVDFNNSVNINSGLFIRNNVIGSTLYTSFTITKASSTQTLSYLFSTGFASNLLFNDAANYSYTFPTASGTIALTSNINYPVTSVFGRTGAVVATEGDYSLTQLSDVTITTPTNGQVLKYNGTAWINDTDANTGTVTSVGLSSGTSGVTIGSSPITTSGTITLAIATASGSQNGLLSSTDWTTFNGKQNSITLTTTGSSGAATLVGSTLNIPNYGSALSGYVTLDTTQTITGLKTFSSDITGQSNIYVTNIEGGVYADYFGRYSTGATPLSFLYGSTGSVVWNNGGAKMTLSSAGALSVVSSISATSATLNGNVIINSTATALSPLQVVATGTIVRLGEQSGTTGKQFLIGIDATSGRTELQSVWQGTSFTSLALQPSGGNVLIGTTGDNGAKLQVNGTATFSGNLEVNGQSVVTNAGTLTFVQLNNTSVGGQAYTLISAGVSNPHSEAVGTFYIRNSSTSTTPFKIASTGFATFSSSVAVGDSVSLLGELYWGGINSGQKVRAYPTGASGSATLNFSFWNGSTWVIQGTLTSAGVWNTTGGGTSDARTKEEIDYNFDNGIESILKLQPTKFKFKIAPNKQRRGFIAQDVLEVIPDLVLGDGEKEDGTYGLDYDGILAIAVKAIQELEARIKQLENK